MGGLNSAKQRWPGGRSGVADAEPAARKNRRRGGGSKGGPENMLELPDGEAHVWYCWTEECLAEDRGRYYRSLLSADERARMDRFAFDYLKREYLVTRALCRITLSRYVDRRPSEWRFEVNRYGRPEIRDSGIPLRFNLSNARSIVACVITAGLDAGVDVEETDRPGETVGIADRYFSRRELEDLRSLPPACQTTRFFQFWTLKESYIKARGMGLAIPLEQFSFDLRGDRVRIDFDPALADRPERWQFGLYRPSTRHMLAVGIRRRGPEDLAVQVRTVVPRAALVGDGTP